MTDAEKIEKIWAYVRSVREVDYSDDPYSDSGGNFDDAFSLGADYGESVAARTIENILASL